MRRAAFVAGACAAGAFGPQLALGATTTQETLFARVAPPHGIGCGW
ncbi:MAG: hypothetical protein ABI186_07960 [Candidatus Elarobacter sp.]